MNRKFKKGDRVKVKTTDIFIDQEIVHIFSHYSCWDSICFIITDNGLLPIDTEKIYLDRSDIINKLLEE